MPSYADVMSKLGGAAGGSAGAVGGAGAGGLLGRLGSLLEPLSYPQQALYGLGRAVSRGFSGEGNWNDVLGALPGAMGAGLAGGLMATGVGAPLGILAGAGLGGLAQGIGKASDASSGTERFKQPEVGDLAESLGLDRGNPITNFGLGALTDPLTFGGGIGGRAVGAAKGAELGASYGSRLERVAAGMSPHSQDVSKLARLLESPLSSPTEQRRMESIVNDLLRNKPEIAKQVAGEIPDEALSMKNPVLGAGVSAIGVKRPEGGVLRIALGESGGLRGKPPIPEPPRLNVPELVQPARSVSFGEQVRAEHLPYVQTFNADVNDISQADQTKKALLQAMQGRGLDPKDLHYGNFGLDPQGAPKILDPGRITGSPEALSQYAGKETARQPGTALERWFLKLFDPHGVSNELAEKLARPNPWGEIPNQGVTGSFTPLASTNPKPQLASAIEGAGRAPVPAGGVEPSPSALERLMRGGEGGGASSPLGQPPQAPQQSFIQRLVGQLDEQRGLAKTDPQQFRVDEIERLKKLLAAHAQHGNFSPGDLEMLLHRGVLSDAQVSQIMGGRQAVAAQLMGRQTPINSPFFTPRDPTTSDLERLMRGGEGGAPGTPRSSSPFSPLLPGEREEAEAISGIHGMKEGESMFGSPLIDPSDWVATRMKTMDATELQRGITRMSKMKNLDREDVEYLNMMRNELHRRGIA